MKQVKIKMNDKIKLGAMVFVDNERMSFKKNSSGQLEACLETDDNRIKLEIIKYHQYDSKYWCLWSILFFLVSVLGIFDNRNRKNTYTVDVSYVFDLTADKNEIFIDIKKEVDSISILLNSNLNYVKNDGVCCINTNAKKRLKIEKTYKAIIRICVIIGIIVLIVLKTKK